MLDDLQRQTEDVDRDRVAARINRAHDEGRIGVAYRDIRLGNVRSAQSMHELDLITRELDQLETARPSAPADTPGPTAEAPWSRFEQGAHDASTSRPSRPLVVTLAVVVAIAVVLAGVVYVWFRAADVIGEESSTSRGVQPASEPASPGTDEPDPGSTVPSGPAYALTAAGITGFLETYRRRFGTSLVVDLTLYGDYAIVNVPAPGKARQAGWLFRGSEWTRFGDVRALFPGAQIVNTRRLAIEPLVRNIKRARATLNVEGPAQPYVVLRFTRPSDVAPRVDIHVANRFSESGYLATTLDGTLKRAYPYGQ